MQGYLDKILVTDVVKFEQHLLELINSKYQKLLINIKKEGAITPEIDLELKKLFVSNF